MDDEFLTTSQAAQRLGVKPATLYAYVSRGLLRSVRRPGQQQSLYNRAEIDNLATAPSSARRESGALLRFRSVISAVSTQDERDLYYRGRPVGEVCSAMSAAQAARFLLDVDDSIAPVRPGGGDLRAADLEVIRGVGVARRLPVSLALLGARDPMRADTTPQGLAARTLGLLQMTPTLYESIVDVTDPLVEALVICLMDNGMAASTTAARVAASARAGWYDVLGAGLAAMGGRLHGGAPVAARRMLRDVLDGHPADEVVALAIETHGHVPGFGHVIYRGQDPRCTALIEVLQRSDRGREESAAMQLIASATPSAMNIDAMSAVICQALELPDRAGEAIFQLARCVGITAHAIEEYAEEPLRWRVRADGMPSRRGAAR